MFYSTKGASCSIRRASLQIRLACDLDTATCQSYQRNFPGALLQQMNIFDLIEQLEYSYLPTLPYQRNFPGAPLQQMNIFDLIKQLLANLARGTSQERYCSRWTYLT